ncbi:FecCD family ABC transporter permease [Nonomuraea endophytica]|uniref:Iron complex transport system permease protein n=1 Tax=Nonomuraea endophytica TaxID=714136 RepID=A0A7W8A270_9ACTN|nr:iron chelate uptake ABC transporter family permease subunit [Nonomuraea endophytica]MBB5077495.1 iron complex transport system permease protein [Nonomuraea endophytica]
MTRTLTERPVKRFTLRAGGWSYLLPLRAAVVTCALVVVTLAVGVVSLGSGDYPLSPAQVIAALTGDGGTAGQFVVMRLRLPRLLVALGVGAALAVGGAVLQTLTRNALGSPDIIGLDRGAATGALLGILVLGGGSAAIAGSAVVGGALALVAVYLLAFRGGLRGARFVLVGVCVAAMLGAVNAYLITRADLWSANQAATWLVGSVAGSRWGHVAAIWIACGVLLPVLAAMSSRLRLLEMGDEVAVGLGVRAERARLAALACASALTCVAIATAGPILFVALTAPQLARRLTGVAGPPIWASAAMGALLMVVSDLAAQRLFGQAQLPTGVVTGAIGGGYLLWMLGRRRTA